MSLIYMLNINHLLLFIALIVMVLVYVKLAKYFNIIDVPNERSSHVQLTIRGIGIIAVPFLVLTFLLFDLLDYWLLLSLCIGSITGFIDDLVNLRKSMRLPLYLLAVLLLVLSIGWSDIAGHIPLFIIGIIVALGTVNAFNFMDGINGITLLYALTCLLTSYFFSQELQLYVMPNNLLIAFILLIMVLLFLNLRKKALAFIGDSGSIMIGLLCSFIVLALISKTRNISMILLLGIYGVDSVGTIIYRMVRKENIFKPHRLHIYQKLANELGHGHLKVAILYAIIQLTLNIAVYVNFQVWYIDPLVFLVIVLLLLAALYYAMRKYVIKDFNSKFITP